MNARQTHRLNAYRATAAVVQAAVESQGVVALEPRLTLLAAKIGEINTLGHTQTEPTEGQTDQSESLLAAMVDAAVDVATILALLAEDQRLLELAATVNLSARDFHHARKFHRPILARRILDAAEAHVSQLLPYGVTAATLAQLQAQIEAAGAGLHQPRTTLTAKRAATLRMAVLFTETDALLNQQIDRLMFPLRRTHPELYAHYRAARQVQRDRRIAAAAPDVVATG